MLGKKECIEIQGRVLAQDFDSYMVWVTSRHYKKNTRHASGAGELCLGRLIEKLNVYLPHGRANLSIQDSVNRGF